MRRSARAVARGGRRVASSSLPPTSARKPSARTRWPGWKAGISARSSTYGRRSGLRGLDGMTVDREVPERVRAGHGRRGQGREGEQDQGASRFIERLSGLWPRGGRSRGSSVERAGEPAPRLGRRPRQRSIYRGGRSSTRRACPGGAPAASGGAPPAQRPSGQAPRRARRRRRSTAGRGRARARGPTTRARRIPWSTRKSAGSRSA